MCATKLLDDVYTSRTAGGSLGCARRQQRSTAIRECQHMSKFIFV